MERIKIFFKDNWRFMLFLLCSFLFYWVYINLKKLWDYYGGKEKERIRKEAIEELKDEIIEERQVNKNSFSPYFMILFNDGHSQGYYVDEGHELALENLVLNNVFYQNFKNRTNSVTTSTLLNNFSGKTIEEANKVLNGFKFYNVFDKYSEKHPSFFNGLKSVADYGRVRFSDTDGFSELLQESHKTFEVKGNYQVFELKNNDTLRVLSHEIALKDLCFYFTDNMFHIGKMNYDALGNFKFESSFAIRFYSVFKTFDFEGGEVLRNEVEANLPFYRKQALLKFVSEFSKIFPNSYFLRYFD